jgi:hypothetical protein
MYGYNLPPDYWLVEISGIPFGLYGEMLQGGGNPWRGMLYGMTNRLHWQGDPREIWKLWDAFGIADARMIGYWEPDCPVGTGDPSVLATVYRKPGRSLVSIASWAEGKADCRLGDWKALGLDPGGRTCSRQVKFNRAGCLDNDPIPVAPGRGGYSSRRAAHEAPPRSTRTAAALLLTDGSTGEALGRRTRTLSETGRPRSPCATAGCTSRPPTTAMPSPSAPSPPARTWSSAWWTPARTWAQRGDRG